jgi:hypothetical protein
LPSLLQDRDRPEAGTRIRIDDAILAAVAYLVLIRDRATSLSGKGSQMASFDRRHAEAVKAEFARQPLGASVLLVGADLEGLPAPVKRYPSRKEGLQ